jgi:hypothetical protein
MESWTDIAVKFFLRCLRVYRNPVHTGVPETRYIRVYQEPVHTGVPPYIFLLSPCRTNTCAAPPSKKQKMRMAQDFCPKSADGAIDGRRPARQPLRALPCRIDRERASMQPAVETLAETTARTMNPGVATKYAWRGSGWPPTNGSPRCALMRTCG